MTTVYDAGAEFSATSNPDGVWSYEAGNQLMTTYISEAPSVGYWQTTYDYYYPSVTGNMSGTTWVDGAGAHILPDYLYLNPVMQPSADLVFTAPQAGVYTLI